LRKRQYIEIAICVFIVLIMNSCANGHWHEMAEFNGSIDQITEVFNIPEGSAQSKWTAYVEPLEEGFYFKCLLRKVGEEDKHIGGLELEYRPGVALSPEKSGWIIEATGDLYYDIEAQGCNWQIIVESYY